MSYKFPLATSTWGDQERNAIQRVIAEGIFTMGKNVLAFENDFSKYINSKYCVMVNSGSSAILLMIAALFYSKNDKFKLKRGDEVIVPAVSWSTTYYPLYQYGLKIKFVDIDLNTLNYDLDQLEKAVTKETRVIMAVNLLGNPNDFFRIKEIINSRDILLLEDNCESMGAKFGDKYTGTFGIMGGFSTFFSHHISTMEGGLIVTDDEELYHILLSLRAHGWTRNLPKYNLVCGKKSDDYFEESFRFVLPGYNLRPLEIAGSLGIEQVKRLPTLISERRKNAKLFQDTMINHPNLIIQKEIAESSWFGFSLVIRPGSSLTRRVLIEKLNKIGFECRPIVAGNFAKNEVVKYFHSEVHGSLKNADHIDQHGLFIGNHHYPMTEALEVLKNMI
jgi:CDP-6-deoxy-D-xylo-4-hexulose-3-dehydrase